MQKGCIPLYKFISYLPFLGSAALGRKQGISISVKREEETALLTANFVDVKDAQHLRSRAAYGQQGSISPFCCSVEKRIPEGEYGGKSFVTTLKGVPLLIVSR